jgi:hypothetical protein
VLGGAVNPELGGLYYQPTLLTGAAPGSEIMTEEDTWSFDFYGDAKNTVYAPEGWHGG